MVDEDAMGGRMSQGRTDWSDLEGRSCAELRSYLDEAWDTLSVLDRMRVAGVMAEKGCEDAVPYLLRQLASDEPLARSEALGDLAHLRRRECRDIFIDRHLHDPDPMVRSTALFYLSVLFGRQREEQIVRLAVAAFDDASNDVETRLRAAAAIQYQLETGAAHGDVVFWSECEEELRSPAVVGAVGEGRRFLRSRGKGADTGTEGICPKVPSR